MDLIVELIKAIVAAFEERKKKNTPEAVMDTSSTEVREVDVEAAEALAAMQRRIAEKQEALRHQREAEAAAHTAVEARPTHRAAKAAVESPRISRPASSAQRMARLLRQPSTIREVIVLSELLGPPKALRHGRR